MDTSDRTILKRLLLALVVVVLIGVVVWIFFIRDSGKTTKRNAGASTSASQRQNSAQHQTQNQSSQNTSNEQLAKTGPDNAAPVFVGATIAGAIFHHMYVHRRRTITQARD